MKLCELCGKEHDGSYGSGRFCCQSCARKSANKLCDINKKNKKISQSLRKRSIDDIRKSAIKGIDTYNRNHPEHQISQVGIVRPITYHNNGLVIISKLDNHKFCRICGSPVGMCKQESICSYLKHCPNLLNLVKLNVDISKLGSSEIYNEMIKFINLLNQLYLVDKLSIQQIQKKYQLKDWYIVASWLKRFGIKTRSMSDAVTTAIKEGRLDYSKISSFMYKTYHHTTWDGQEVFLRSSYEYDYALSLDSNKIKYQVEPFKFVYFCRFFNKEKISIPDFYLPESNTIVEVKGDFTYTKSIQEDKFKKCVENGFSCKLILERQEYIYPELPEQKCKQTIDNYWNC